MPPDTLVLTADRFAALMAAVGPFPQDHPLALGCSGGPDSLALALCLRDWCAVRGHPLTALIVDHRLRLESGAEAARVQARLEQAGIPARVLTLSDAEIPRRSIQAQARAARYARLLDWCQTRGVQHLFLAHHLEDQAETFLLRLARGSGVDGLAAMRPVEHQGGVRLLRPLLDIPKAALAATVVAADMVAENDPGNSNPAFARVRLRQLAPALAAEGLTPARLAATARHMARARDALEQETLLLLRRAARLHPEGCISLSPATFAAAPAEVALRGLSRAVMAAAGRVYPPRFQQLERLHAVLQTIAEGSGCTLAGCMVARRRGLLWLGREPGAARQVLALSQPGMARWDGRFDIRWTRQAVPATGQAWIAAAGIAGARCFSGRAGLSAREDGPRPPAFVRQTVPMLWRDGQPVCPLVGPGAAAAQGISEILLVARLFPEGDLFNIPASHYVEDTGSNDSAG